MPETIPIVHLGLDSTQPAVSAALTGVSEKLHDFGLSDDDLSTAEIVLAEVLNNVVEHAYADEPGHLVELWVEHANNAIRCRVRDEGTPIREGELPDGKAVDVDVPNEDLPEGGFGWFLIKTLAQDISYERKKGQNTLRFALQMSA